MKLTNIIKQIIKENIGSRNVPLVDLEFGKDIIIGNSVPSAVGEWTRIKDVQDFQTWKSNMLRKWGPNLQINIDQASSRDQVTIPIHPSNKIYNDFIDRVSDQISQNYSRKKYSDD